MSDASVTWPWCDPTSPVPRTWKTLRDVSFQTAREKGWWDDCMSEGQLLYVLVTEKVEEKVALVHSELSEALEDFRIGKMKTEFRAADGKPEGCGSELGDVCIRWWDLLGALKAANPIGSAPVYYEDESVAELVRRENLRSSGRWWDRGFTVPAAICRLHRGVAGVLSYPALGEMEWCYSQRAMEASLLEVLAYATTLGYDMEKEIAIKQGFNKTRDYMHGGKRC